MKDDDELARSEDGLDQNYADNAATALRAALGGIPAVGPTLAEVFTMGIPRQRMDRFAEFVRVLETRVEVTEADVRILKERTATPEGAMFTEEVGLAAARTLSATKREFLATLMTRSLTGEQVDLSQSRRVAEILSSLDEGDLIYLVFYSEPRGLNSSSTKEFMERHAEIVHPVARTLNATDEEQARGAMQDSYKARLLGLALIEPGTGEKSMKLTALGRLVLRLAQPEEQSTPGLTSGTTASSDSNP